MYYVGEHRSGSYLMDCVILNKCVGSGKINLCLDANNVIVEQYWYQVLHIIYDE